MKEEEGLYYPCSENKGADQLRSYCEADLYLCLRLCRLFVFPCSGLFNNKSLFPLSSLYMTIQLQMFTIVRIKSIGNDSVILIARER